MAWDDVCNSIVAGQLVVAGGSLAGFLLATGVHYSDIDERQKLVIGGVMFLELIAGMVLHYNYRPSYSPGGRDPSLTITQKQLLQRVIPTLLLAAAFWGLEQGEDNLMVEWKSMVGLMFFPVVYWAQLSGDKEFGRAFWECCPESLTTRLCPRRARDDQGRILEIWSPLPGTEQTANLETVPHAQRESTRGKRSWVHTLITCSLPCDAFNALSAHQGGGGGAPGNIVTDDVEMAITNQPRG